jgi:serine/threonine protein kinase
VEELTEQYLARLHAGRALDRQVLLRAHPELAERLERELELLEMLFRLGGEPGQKAELPGWSGAQRATDRPACAGEHRPFPDWRTTRSWVSWGGAEWGLCTRARQKSLNRVVALKVISSGASAGVEERVRFRLEAEAVASLQHPNIVQVHGVGEEEGTPFLALEFVDGGSLADAIAGRPQPGRLTATIVESPRATHFAHQRGIVHRDLKPANILLSFASPGSLADVEPAALRLDACVPKITDFGLAKRWQEQSSGPTLTSDIVGTPCYMAPSRPGAAASRSPRPRTFTRWAVSCTKCSAGDPRSLATSLAVMMQVLTAEPPLNAGEPGSSA